MRRTKNVLTALRQARGIDRHAGSPPSFSARAAQPAHRLADGPLDGLVVEALQETVQRREVGHTRKPQCLAQFAMLAKTHLGFAKGPVFVAHQTEDGQQLRLSELVLAETASVARKHRLGDLHGDASERQESDSGHRTSCLRSKQQLCHIGYREISQLSRGCQQSQIASKYF
jgi:hypothetical protein